MRSLHTETEIQSSTSDANIDIEDQQSPVDSDAVPLTVPLRYREIVQSVVVSSGAVSESSVSVVCSSSRWW